MIKKLVSYLIILSMCFSLVCLKAPEKALALEANQISEVIAQLGFIGEDKEATAEVTRGEFATIALKLYGIPVSDEHSAGVETPFADVPKEHYKSADILKANKMGILNGYGDGNFYPEKTVLLSEAVKILMDILGYSDFIAYRGGYPVGYMTEASKIDMIVGINKNYDSIVTYGDLSQMIYAILDEPLVQISGIGEDSMIFGKDENITLLSKYHKIYKGTGVLSGTSVTRINAAYDSDFAAENTVIINDTSYQTKTSEFDKLLGLNTEYYYHYDGGVKTLVCAVESENKVCVFAGEDVISANTESIKVFGNNSKETIYRFENTGNVIYNGVYAGKVYNYPLNTLLSVAGSIRITDTDTNGLYDVVFITDYKTYVVDKSSADAQKIILKDNTSSFVIELDNSDIFCSVEKKGNQILPDALETGMVVSVADSNNSPVLRGSKRQISIIVCDTSIKASVSEISDEGVYLWQKGEEGSGTLYKISNTFFGKNGETKLTLHSSGVFYIDVVGEVAYYTSEEADEFKFGYIIEAGMHQSSMEKAYGIKLLSQTGEILCLYTSDNLKLDGAKVSCESVHSVLEASSNVEGSVKQLVRFRTNSEGKISELDTSIPNATPDFNELTKTHVSTGATYRNNMKTFVMGGTDERYILSDTVKIFLIPTDPQAKDDDFQVRAGSYFSNNSTYGTSGQKLFVYNVIEAEPQAMELQINKISLGLGGVSQYNDDLAVVLGSSRIAGKGGEEYYSINVMIKNAQKKLTINPDRVKFMRFEENSVTSGTLYKEDGVTKLGIDDFKFGDLILFYEDDTGEARTVLKINENDPRTWKNGSYAIMHKGGYLERMWGGVLKVDGRKLLLDVSSETYPERTIWANLLGSLQVYLVDFNTETVRTASFNDIIFSENDALSDKVFVRTRSYVPKQVVIYRGVEVSR